ncbi:MAG: AAA family ATPase [Candidatus Pacebacteria bacterium]|nr:AAA family ATPase [Candidatus Paceibacterota bacterium]
MNSFFIGIAGGSGAGKTKLAQELKKHFGRKAKILHIDKYQRFGEKLPKLCGMENWDCPQVIKWNELYKDLISLKKEKRIIIAEGYLLFYKSSIRRLLDFLIFLTASDKTRVRRRTKFKNSGYIQKVLLPMHKKYIEPTKKFADLILNTEKYSIKHCSQEIIQHLPKKF